jgi:hypothetical protein
MQKDHDTLVSTYSYDANGNRVDYNSNGALSYSETDFGGSSIFQTSFLRDSLGK